MGCCWLHGGHEYQMPEELQQLWRHYTICGASCNTCYSQLPGWCLCRYNRGVPDMGRCWLHRSDADYLPKELRSRLRGHSTKCVTCSTCDACDTCNTCYSQLPGWCLCRYTRGVPDMGRCWLHRSDADYLPQELRSRLRGHSTKCVTCSTCDACDTCGTCDSCESQVCCMAVYACMCRCHACLLLASALGVSTRSRHAQHGRRQAHAPSR